MSSEIAIRVTNLSKCYQIYDQPHDRLKQSIYPRFQRLLRRPSSQYFREFWSLKEVSFEIKKGETIGIIGRNGSGKSTLLQMICGTLNPTDGHMETQGRIAALLELGSGFNPEFTGRENIFMNAAVLGLSKEETAARFEEIVAFADIGSFIEQPVKTYSSGMMLRLAFAVIAHVDADILVIDEALAVGDAFFTQKCMRFLRGFMRTGTVLFVSHDTSAVVNLCSSAILLEHGRVVMSGNPKQVSEHYLAKLYEVNQDIKGSSVELLKALPIAGPLITEYRDMRQEFINASRFRNDIEIFKFEESGLSGFGTGGALVKSVCILDAKKNPMSWVVGGEDVILSVRCLVNQSLLRPIIGFQFKDRLGQIIFADNTFIAYKGKELNVAAGQVIVAQFCFNMPILPSGDYSVTVAIADGSQEGHIQHHWVHDALIVRVHASSVCQGLVGLRMKSIDLGIEEER